MTSQSIAEENLLRAIFASSPCNEPYHENGCPACDIVSEIVGSLAAYWDVHDTWWTELITDAKWPPGITVAMQAEKIVAFILHRQMPKNTGDNSA